MVEVAWVQQAVSPSSSPILLLMGDVVSVMPLFPIFLGTQFRIGQNRPECRSIPVHLCIMLFNRPLQTNINNYVYSV